MHRTRNSIGDKPTTKSRSGGNEKNLTCGNHEEKSKKGIRKRIEVVLSKFRHHEGFRTKLRKGVHIFFMVSIIASVIIVALNLIDLIPYNNRFGKLPHNMVQLVGEDYSRLQFLSQMNLNWGPLKNNHHHEHKHKHGHENFEVGNCKAMHQWQLEAYPTCNLLHETDMNKLDHVGRGGFRDVWAMTEWNGTKVAVKTLADRKKFTHKEYDRHRRDAVVMALLTSSKHIPNIYGYCTNSGMFDFSANGTMEDHMKKRWTKQQKLRYSWQATTALADVHDIAQ